MGDTGEYGWKNLVTKKAVNFTAFFYFTCNDN
jgi:hypothetical protein